MKKLTIFLVWGLMMLGLVKVARANEGIFRMLPQSGSGMNCFVTSIYIDGTYKMIGTCRGLTMAYSAEQTKYVLWKMEEGETKWTRVDEVTDGKITASSGKKFTSLAISAETPVYARTPEGPVVMEGDMEQIPFAGGSSAINIDSGLVRVSVTATPTRKAQPLLSTSTDTTQSGVSKVVSTIGRIVLFLFIALIVIVIVMAVVMRRKENKLE